MFLALSLLVSNVTVDVPPVHGRLILIIAAKSEREPRELVTDNIDTAQIFGVDIDTPTRRVVFDDRVLGYPLDKLSQVPAAEYNVQAVLNVYELHVLADGRRLWLPPDRGEGQHWNEKPGNPYSAPVTARLGDLHITLDRVIAELPPVVDTKYVKHVRMQSERLTKFWGRPTFLSANVLLPEGFDSHATAHYPLVIAHGHYSRDFEGFASAPPDATLPAVNLAAIRRECPNGHEGELCKKHGYDRLVQEYAQALYKAWTGPKFPRVLLVEINHPTPYYDDSYAVNSAAMGPYGDAISYELVPFLEKQFRGLGPWARAMMGGSTGGWEALAAQIFYPTEYNGAYASCPDPVTFSSYTTVDLYHDANAYEVRGMFQAVQRPAERDYLGRIRSYVGTGARRELVLGSKSRSGEQWDIWQAVYSPTGPDGYPAPIWDKRTGVIDHVVAEYWREHFDLDFIVKRDWQRIGSALRGKLEVNVGLFDNFYLNNAVYRFEETLNALDADAHVDYGARDEHCWSGDHVQPNAIARLTYAPRFIPRMVARFLRTAPKGADVTSWRY